MSSDSTKFLFDSDEGGQPPVEYILHGWDLDRTTGLYRLFVENKEGQRVVDVPVRPPPPFADEPEAVVFASADELTLPCVCVNDGSVTDISMVMDQTLHDGRKHTFLVCACEAYLVDEWHVRSPMTSERHYFDTSSGSAADRLPAKQDTQAIDVNEDGDAVVLGGQRRKLTPQQQAIVSHYRKQRRKALYIREVCQAVGYKGGVNSTLSAIFRDADIRNALFVEGDGKEKWRLRSTVKFRKP